MENAPGDTQGDGNARLFISLEGVVTCTVAIT